MPEKTPMTYLSYQDSSFSIHKIMYNASLSDLFKHLTKTDRKQLKKIVRSPFYNQREDVIALFDYIDLHIDKGAVLMQKEKVFAAVYPDKKFDVDTLYYTMSFLTQIIQKYLTLSELEEHTTDAQLYLYKALLKRGAEKAADKTLSDAKNYLEKQKLRNDEYHYHHYKIGYEETKAVSKHQRGINLDFQKIADHFYYFVLSQTLKLGYNFLSQQKVSKEVINFPLILPVINLSKNIDVAAVKMQFNAYKVSENKANEEDDFFKLLKSEIVDRAEQFDDEELRDCLLVAINYAILKQNQGNLDYVKEAMFLHRFGLDKKFMFEDGVLSPYYYKNAAMLALKINDFEWAEKFLHDFKQYLPATERDNIFKFNLAVFNFRKKNFDTAMNLLQEVNFKEVPLNLDVRRLLARTYYELNEMTALFSLVENSKIYLHRQKEKVYIVEMYSNFFKFLEKILKTNLKNAADKEKIRLDITETKLLAEREWLAGLVS